MGINNSPDIFQQMINDLFYRFEFIRAYMDEFLTLKKVYWTYHVQKLELTLDKHKEKESNVILESLSSDRPKYNI